MLGTHALEVAHLAHQHGVAQVDVGRGGVEADFDGQRLAPLEGLREPRFKFVFGDEIGDAAGEDLQLFGHRRHLAGHGFPAAPA